MSYKINKKTYAQTYGPTKGDRVRLADTELIIEVEKDFTTYGDEVCRGCKRFQHEVIQWNSYSDQQKEIVWNRLEALKVQLLIICCPWRVSHRRTSIVLNHILLPRAQITFF